MTGISPIADASEASISGNLYFFEADTTSGLVLSGSYSISSVYNPALEINTLFCGSEALTLKIARERVYYKFDVGENVYILASNKKYYLLGKVDKVVVTINYKQYKINNQWVDESLILSREDYERWRCGTRMSARQTASGYLSGIDVPTINCVR